MSDKNKIDVIGENESIQEGLEHFLETELSGQELPKRKTGTSVKKQPVKREPVKKEAAKKPAPGPKKRPEPATASQRPLKKSQDDFDSGFQKGYQSAYQEGFAAGYQQAFGKKPGLGDEYVPAEDFDPAYEEPYDDPYDSQDAYEDYDGSDENDGYDDGSDDYVVYDIYDEEPSYGRVRENRGTSAGRKKAPVGRDRRHEAPARREKDKRERAAAEKRIKAAQAAKAKTAEKRQKEKEKKARGKKGKEGEKKKHSLLKFLLVLAILLLILYILMNKLVGSAYDKMTYEQPEELAGEPMKEEGVTNVLLIGNDSRENSDDGRSDAMILISMNPKKKTIYMTSFLRDMYVTIPGHGENRLNAAYAYGGAALLCQTIKENFDIEVNRYAIVNFQAFAALVDAVGGVDLELTAEEVEWVNAYLNEYNMLEGREMTTDYLDTSKSGMLHLNGPQALAYSRNRYIGTDFGRTERQRKVLSAIMGKIPMAMATNADGLIDGIFPYLTTNLKRSEVTELSMKAGSAATYETVQLTIPADGTWSNANIGGKAVLQVDFEANKKILQEEIYDKKEEQAQTTQSEE